MNTEESEIAVKMLVDIIKFRTISGTASTDGSYNQCASWIQTNCSNIGLETEIIPESLDGKPIVVAKWIGANPDLPIIILNSHYDVVPVIEEYWTMPSFDGHIQNGKIYGRGTQDMKSVCVQYIFAIKSLKQEKYQPARTIILTFVPDEEIGGLDGMNILLNSTFFKQYRSNIGIALDEGLASEDETYSLFYGERLPWWITVTAVGNTGHGSRFIEGTAVEQIVSIAQKALEFRSQQKALLHNNNQSSTNMDDNENQKKRPRGTDDKHLHENCSHSVAFKKKKTLGDVTSLNITTLRAGISSGGIDTVNLVPSEAIAKFDIRIAPHVSPQFIADTLDGWCQEITSKTVGLPQNGGIRWDYIGNPLKMHQVTEISDSSKPSNLSENKLVNTYGSYDPKCDNSVKENRVWLELIESTLLNKFQIHIQPSVFPAATDSRFLRSLGIRAFGFSPIRNSPILLHEHDEYLSIDVFLEGCLVYIDLIKALASQPTILV